MAERIFFNGMTDEEDSFYNQKYYEADEKLDIPFEIDFELINEEFINIETLNARGHYLNTIKKECRVRDNLPIR